MNPAVPTGAEDLGDAKGVMLVGLVAHGRECCSNLTELIQAARSIYNFNKMLTPRTCGAPTEGQLETRVLRALGSSPYWSASLLRSPPGCAYRINARAAETSEATF